MGLSFLGACVLHDGVKQVAQFVEVVRLRDLLTVAFDLLVVFAGAFGDAAQTIDKSGHQALQRGLGIGQALGEHALLDDSLAQAAFGIGDDMLVYRIADDLTQGEDLAVQPFLILYHFANVLHQQAQQAQQLLYLDLVAAA